MKYVEVRSCADCRFAVLETDGTDLICDLDDNGLPLKDVEQGETHDGCPLRSGPVQFQLSKQGSQWKTCRDCHEQFEVSKGEIEFLRRQFGENFGMPTRCLPCRRARKKAGR
jgi:hypothetical protein